MQMDVKCIFMTRNEDYFIQAVPKPITIMLNPEQKVHSRVFPIPCPAIVLCLWRGGAATCRLRPAGGQCLHMQIAHRKRAGMNFTLQCATGNVSKPYTVEISSIFHNQDNSGLRVAKNASCSNISFAQSLISSPPAAATFLTSHSPLPPPHHTPLFFLATHFLTLPCHSLSSHFHSTPSYTPTLFLVLSSPIPSPPPPRPPENAGSPHSSVQSLCREHPPSKHDISSTKKVLQKAL